MNNSLELERCTRCACIATTKVEILIGCIKVKTTGISCWRVGRATEGWRCTRLAAEGGRVSRLAAEGGRVSCRLTAEGRGS